MKKSRIWAGLGIIIILMILAGILYFNNQDSDQTSGSSLFASGKMSDIEVSKLTLEVSDLPEGFIVDERTPRTPSDVSQEGLDLGWKEGYYIRFSRRGNSIFDVSVIEQGISRYPPDTISDAVGLTALLTEDYTAERLPDPKIGEKSASWRYTDDELELRTYQIEFYKKDIYMSFIMSGTSTDYESLKSLAEKAERKI